MAKLHALAASQRGGDLVEYHRNDQFRILLPQMRIAGGEFRDEFCPGHRRLRVDSRALHAMSNEHPTDAAVQTLVTLPRQYPRDADTLLHRQRQVGPQRPGRRFTAGRGPALPVGAFLRSRSMPARIARPSDPKCSQHLARPALHPEHHRAREEPG